MSKKQKPVYVWVARDLKGEFDDRAFLYTSKPRVVEIGGLVFYLGNTTYCSVEGFELCKGQLCKFQLVEVKE